MRPMIICPRYKPGRCMGILKLKLFLFKYANLGTIKSSQPKGYCQFRGYFYCEKIARKSAVIFVFANLKFTWYNIVETSHV